MTRSLLLSVALATGCVHTPNPGPAEGDGPVPPGAASPAADGAADGAEPTPTPTPTPCSGSASVSASVAEARIQSHELPPSPAVGGRGLTQPHGGGAR